MKKLIIMVFTILALIVGFILGFFVTTAAISQVAYKTLEHFGYDPTPIIRECMTRAGL